MDGVSRLQSPNGLCGSGSEYFRREPPPVQVAVGAAPARQASHYYIEDRRQEQAEESDTEHAGKD